MKRYPTYKDSGVEWLGQVPKGWQVVPLKVPFSIVGGTTPKSDNPDYWDGAIPWITPADLSNLPDRFVRETGRRITLQGLNSCGTTLVAAGAIALSTRAPIGSIAITTIEACTNQGCRLLAANDSSESSFFYYALLSAREQLNLLGRGSTFLELSGDQLGAFRVPLPPLPEQRAIPDFLDRETAKIDAFVEEQRRLISLLTEKRQAVISHAVTKGLNPTAPLKPSGIDWLGDIPEGWKVVKVGSLCDRMTYGFTNPMPTTDEGPFMLTAADIDGGRIQYESARRTSLEAYSEFLTDKSRPVAGDVLVTKDGTLGRVALADGEVACINQSVALLRPSGEAISPAYLAAVLTADPYQARMLFEAGGTTIKHIYISRLGRMPIALPPLEEQAAIVDLLSIRRPELDALVDAATSAITLLQERRAALISAAVTGKIDVRETMASVTASRQSLNVSAMVAGVVIAKLGRQPDHGRVWLQKMLFMAQSHANIEGIGGNYLRAANGPLDIGLRDQVEADLSAANAIRVTREPGDQGAYRYDFIGDASQLRSDLAAEIGDRMDGFLRLMDLLGDMGTRQIEAVATLYAAWNDFLIDGKAPSDADLVHEVLENWHPRKKERLSPQYLADQLGWMRRQNIVPSGTGQKTYTDRLFS